MSSKIQTKMSVSNNSNKIACGLCMKEFTTKTLDNYGGMCFNCSKKSVNSNTSFEVKSSRITPATVSKEDKVSCPKCNKFYTQKTLNKYNGICGKCSNMESEQKKSGLNEKGSCTKCSKEFTLKTLSKYAGLCNRCHTKETAVPLISSAFIGIPQVHRA